MNTTSSAQPRKLDLLENKYDEIESKEIFADETVAMDPDSDSESETASDSSESIDAIDDRPMSYDGETQADEAKTILSTDLEPRIRHKSTNLVQCI